MMLNNKHNSKSGRKKDKKKRFQRENKTGNQKKRTHSLKTKKLQFYIFMLFYSWNKSKEERTMKKETKTRNKKKAKEERQEGRKKDKRKRETEKEKQKRGRPKKVKGGRKRNTENKPKNAPFRGKNRFFLLKQRKERNQIGWVSKISLFWQLGPKSAHQKNTIKIGVSANFFLENTYASRNGHCWTKKT